MCLLMIQGIRALRLRNLFDDKVIKLISGKFLCLNKFQRLMSIGSVEHDWVARELHHTINGLLLEKVTWRDIRSKKREIVIFNLISMLQLFLLVLKQAFDHWVAKIRLPRRMKRRIVIPHHVNWGSDLGEVQQLLLFLNVYSDFLLFRIPFRLTFLISLHNSFWIDITKLLIRGALERRKSVFNLLIQILGSATNITLVYWWRGKYRKVSLMGMIRQLDLQFNHILGRVWHCFDVFKVEYTWILLLLLRFQVLISNCCIESLWTD